MKETRLSIFPLSGAILFPGLQLPLHIFEPRYRALVGHSLARDRRIAMIQPQQAFEGAQLFDVGCIGRMDEHVMRRVVEAAKQSLAEMGVDTAAPPADAIAERAKLAA